jgi:ATP-dependent RNA helicase DHX36
MTNFSAIPRSKGCILYCTTGILLQFLQSDPTLKHTSHIVIDEIHEQDILSDFILTIVKDLLPKVKN